MIARLTTREPSAAEPVEPVADEFRGESRKRPVTPCRRPGPAVRSGRLLPAGRRGGHVDAIVTARPSPFTVAEREVSSVTVIYHGYSAEGINILDGTESEVRGRDASGKQTFTWHSDLVRNCASTGTRKTSEHGGFTVAMSSTLGGRQRRSKEASSRP